MDKSIATMKINDILTESSTDLVALFYKEASPQQDARFNSVAANYAEQNKEYYRAFFKDFYKHGEIPVFTKDISKKQSRFTNVPQKGNMQSAGYRGLQMAKRAAGHSYNKDFQKCPSGTTNGLSF